MNGSLPYPSHPDSFEKTEAAVLIVSDGQGKIAALTRNFQPANVNLPGGFVLDTEASPAIAARRILQEKTGLTLESLEIIYSWRDLRGCRIYGYRVTQWRGSPRATSAGKALWVKPEMLVRDTCTFGGLALILLSKAGLV